MANKNPPNQILRSLPPKEYERLIPHLEPLSLRQNDVLSDLAAPIRHGYFIESGLVSTVAVMRDGRSVEVGMVGNEGFVAFPAFLNVARPSSRLVVQISGEAMRIRAEILQQLLPKLPQLEKKLPRFAYLQAVQLEQIAACNTLHEIEPRLARWLLMAADRVGENLTVTHDQTARMLGVRRASVTVAAIAIQERGAVQYARGNLRLLSRRKLEDAACECYPLVHAHLEGYLVALSGRPD
jgi:CRP-like cAMP-binding protein